jgi:hypothetical protein
MSRITRLFVLTIPLASAVACSSGSSSVGSPVDTVTDTLGYVFNVNCSGGICALTPQDPKVKPLACDGVLSGDTFVILWSRILTIHVLVLSSSSSIQVSAAEPSHPVACTSDADCTPWNVTLGSTSYQYTCLNGICQDSALTLGPEDVITLCQADIPWPSACPYVATEPFASRLVKVAATCPPGSSGKSCSVPADCRQVTPAPPVPDGGAQPAPADSSVDVSAADALSADVSSVDLSSVDAGL